MARFDDLTIRVGGDEFVAADEYVSVSSQRDAEHADIHLELAFVSGASLPLLAVAVTPASARSAPPSS